MAILTVGPAGTYATIAAAVSASRDGDVVRVQAGTYTNDFVHVTSRITIEGVGGIVHLVATVAPPDGKAIMTVGADATIRNLDFSGAKVPDNNGAGIRYEGGDLTLDTCSFHDNQNGLLSGTIPGAKLTITNSTFTHNGDGSGYTHNLYVGDIDTLTITGSTFTDAVVGHEIKSRAETTIIQGCTIADGAGNASYSIDLPNGGNALIRNNTIEKGVNAENQTVIHYGGESIAYAGSQLTITGNTVTNDLTAHATILLTNATLIPASITDNTFLGVPIPTYAVGPAILTGNRTASAAVADSSSTDLGNTGNTIYITDAAAHSVVLAHPSMAIKGGAGRLTATGYSHETVVGGSGGVTWNGQDGADSIYTAAGSSNTLNLGAASNVVQSAGNDAIRLNRGNNSVQVVGSATLTGGTGTNAIQVDGTAVIANSGVDTIAVGANGSATVTESNVAYLTSNGGTFSFSHLSASQTVADTITVVGGAANLMALDTGLNVTMGGGSKGAQITLGTGNITLLTRAPDTIRAGAGNDTVILSGSAELFQGTGTLAVFGRGIGGMATVHGGAGTMTIDGDTGNIRYQAEGGAATLNNRLARTVVIGGTSLLTVNAIAGLLTVQGGSGGINLTDTAGGQTVSTAAGSRNVVGLLGGSTLVSNGTDTVSIANGANDTVTANGAATIQGGNGTSLFVLNGASTLNTRSNAVDRVTVNSAAHASVYSNSVYDSIDVAGGQLSYAAAGAAVAITGRAHLEHAIGQTARITTGAGSATRIVVNSAATVNALGNDTVVAGAGAVAVVAQTRSSVQFGAGGGTEVNNGAATISAGTGAVTVDSWSGSLNFVGGAGKALVAVAGGNGTVAAGAGNMTLQGGTGALTFIGGSGTAVVNPGSGSDTVRLGSGAVTVNAWAGHDTLQIVAGQAHGAAVVNGFDAVNDRIQLDGYAPGAAKATSYAGGTLLTLTDGTRVQFAGVSRLPGF